MNNCSFKPKLNDNRSDTSILNKNLISTSFSQIIDKLNIFKEFNQNKKTNNEFERDNLAECSFKPKLTKDISKKDNMSEQNQSNIKKLCQQAEKALDLSKQKIGKTLKDFENN